MKKYILLMLTLFILMNLVGCSAEIDPNIANTPFGMTAIKYELIIALVCYGIGFACIIGGFILTIMGITGDITWIVEAGDFTSKLINASPGIVLMVIGLIIILKAKYKVKSK